MAETSEKSPWILDADEATFQQQVVERSRDVLVVIDFWAPWCQPCRLLGPILEYLARAYDGKFLLVKADTEKLPNIAAGFGVQSIPAVYALRDGQLLDFFVGLRDEQQLRAWIDRLLPSEAETLVSEARRLATTDPNAGRGEVSSRPASSIPTWPARRSAWPRCTWRQGRTERHAPSSKSWRSEDFWKTKPRRSSAIAPDGCRQAAPADLQALRRRSCRRSPAITPSALKLAQSLAAAGQYEEALQIALRLVETHDKQCVEPANDTVRPVEPSGELETDSSLPSAPSSWHSASCSWRRTFGRAASTCRVLGGVGAAPHQGVERVGRAPYCDS